MKSSHWLVLLSAAGIVAACSDGPAENAGEDVDSAIEDVTGEDTDAFEEAGENVDEATEGDLTLGATGPESEVTVNVRLFTCLPQGLDPGGLSRLVGRRTGGD